MVVPSKKFRGNLVSRSLVITDRQIYVRRRCERLSIREINLRTGLFWSITQRIVLILYLSFETNFRFRDVATGKSYRNVDKELTTIRCVTAQKSSIFSSGSLNSRVNEWYHVLSCAR
jgi:hypothetical protein